MEDSTVVDEDDLKTVHQITVRRSKSSGAELVAMRVKKAQSLVSLTQNSAENGQKVRRNRTKSAVEDDFQSNSDFIEEEEEEEENENKVCEMERVVKSNPERVRARSVVALPSNFNPDSKQLLGFSNCI